MRETQLTNSFFHPKKIFYVLVILLFTSTLFAEPYIVIAKKNNFNKRMVNGVKAIGGKITKVHSNLGFAFVNSDSKTFMKDASKIAGIRSVIHDTKVQLIDPNRKKIKAESVGNPPYSGDDDFFFDMQWGHDAVDAPEAWATGARGAGVRVAVLDDGIDSDHPDIAPNLNTSLSTSFVPGQTFEYNENYPGDAFSHGTHTSGTIVAADNGYGTIGIAPEAELVMVKVLDSYTGSGYWSWILNGIVYAANIDADVISMSIGGYAQLVEENAELLEVYARTTLYAYSMGSTLIASTGNDALNMDDYPDWLHLPSQAPKVIGVSATAPRGWATDPMNVNLDEPASYSNYGINHVDFAAPGGDYIFDDGGQYCSIAGVSRPCYVFDFVFSTGSAGAWYWSVGTSMATPHVSGVAALIIGEAGGSLPPDAVFQVLRRTADDLGPRFKDNFYGYGRVNAYKAVKRVHQLMKDGVFNDEIESLPTSFELAQNYPNPFNPSTTIKFSLPADQHVSLKVFDLLGREVANLVNDFRRAGNYSVDFNASQLSSGVYVYQLRAGKFSDTKKLILQK